MKREQPDEESKMVQESDVGADQLPSMRQSKLSTVEPTRAIDEDVLDSNLDNQNDDANLDGDENPDEEFKFKDRSYINSIDSLHLRFNMGYYHNLRTLQDDLEYLVTKVIKTRCKNQLGEEYLKRVLA